MKGMNKEGGTANVPGAKSSPKYAAGYLGNTSKATHPVGPGTSIRTAPSRGMGKFGTQNNIKAAGKPRG